MSDKVDTLEFLDSFKFLTGYNKNFSLRELRRINNKDLFKHSSIVIKYLHNELEISNSILLEMTINELYYLCVEKGILY